MASHGLQMVKSRRPDVLEPEVVDGNENPSSSTGKKFEVSPELAQGVMNLVTKVVDGRHEIDVIRANSDSEIAKVEAEIERIVADAKAYVDKLQADSKAWNEKHDRKCRMVESILSRLDANHPEWSDEIRKKFLDFALAEISDS